MLISPVIVLNVNNSGSLGFSSTRRDYHVHLDCHVMTTDTQYVYIMCMACYDYLLILDGEDGVLTPVVDGILTPVVVCVLTPVVDGVPTPVVVCVLTPVVVCVVCEEDIGAESLTGFDSVER